MKTVKRLVFWGPLTILVALYFFGQNLGFFPGGSSQPAGTDGEPAEQSEVDVTTVKVMAPASESDPRDDRPESDDTPDDAESDDPADTAVSPVPRLMHVLIDDRTLFVAGDTPLDDGSIDWQPIGINEVANRAKEADANDAGLRIRISRRGSSRVSTEMELIEALRNVGLSDDEILIEDKLSP